MSNKLVGDFGEKEVCDLVVCPNCQNKLVLLPSGFPMYDVQCSRCMFRAQVKTQNCRPRSVVFGAGWDIYSKVIKAGYLPPPLIINFKWRTGGGASCQEIRFYPFVARGNIHKYKLSKNAKRANYKMFRYIKLDKIPSIILLQKFDPLNR